MILPRVGLARTGLALAILISTLSCLASVLTLRALRSFLAHLIVASVASFTSSILPSVPSSASRSSSSFGAVGCLLSFEKGEKTTVPAQTRLQFLQDVFAFLLLRQNQRVIGEPPDDERAVGSACHVNRFVLARWRSPVSVGTASASSCAFLPCLRRVLALVLQAYGGRFV